MNRAGWAYDLPLPGDTARPLPAPAWSLTLQLAQALAGELDIAEPSGRWRESQALQGVGPPDAQEAPTTTTSPVHTAKPCARAHGACRLRPRPPLGRASPPAAHPTASAVNRAPVSPALQVGETQWLPWAPWPGGSCSPRAEEGAGEGGLSEQRCLAEPLVGHLPFGLLGRAQGSSGATCPGADPFMSSVFQICRKEKGHGRGKWSVCRLRAHPIPSQWGGGPPGRGGRVPCRC